MMTVSLFSNQLYQLYINLTDKVDTSVSFVILVIQRKVSTISTNILLKGIIIMIYIYIIHTHIHNRFLGKVRKNGDKVDTLILYYSRNDYTGIKVDTGINLSFFYINFIC